MNSEIQLFGSLLSANVRKVAMSAIELNIELIQREINVYAGQGQAPDYLQVNGLGQIPTLVDGALQLRESNAIIFYLADNYSDAKLCGDSAHNRAEIVQWLFWESSQWQPMQVNIMGAQVGHQLFPETMVKPKETNWSSDECVKQLHFLDTNLSDGWLVGSQLSLADLSVVAMTTYFKVAQFPFKQYPNIAKWYDCLSSRDSWCRTEHPLWC